MGDRRNFIKLHDAMPDHPKIAGLSDKAFRTLIEAWCWCKRHLTDGEVPAGVWRKWGNARARNELVTAGMVVLANDGSATMHDFTEHQTSREYVENLSAARKAAGQKGGRPRKADAGAKQAETKMVSNEVATEKRDKTQRTEGRGSTSTPSGVEAAARPRPAQQPELDQDEASQDPGPPASETATQVAQRITRAYYEREPMCKFPAVMAVVKKALSSERFTEQQITDALLRMANEGRSVTVDALRYELRGFPTQRPGLAPVPDPAETGKRRVQC